MNHHVLEISKVQAFVFGRSVIHTAFKYETFAANVIFSAVELHAIRCTSSC